MELFAWKKSLSVFTATKEEGSSAAAVKNQIILLLLLFHLSFIINQSIWYFLKEEMQFEIYMTFKSL